MVTFHFSALHHFTCWVSQHLSTCLDVKSDCSSCDARLLLGHLVHGAPVLSYKTESTSRSQLFQRVSVGIVFPFFLLFSLPQSSSEEIMTAAAQWSQRVKQQDRWLSLCCFTYSRHLVICHSRWQAYCSVMTLSVRYLTASLSQVIVPQRGILRGCLTFSAFYKRKQLFKAAASGPDGPSAFSYGGRCLQSTLHWAVTVCAVKNHFEVELPELCCT